MKRMRGQIRTTTTICDCNQIDQQQVGTPVHTASDDPTPNGIHYVWPSHLWATAMPSHPCRLFRGANKINPEDTGMHFFQTCNDLVMCALRDDSGLLQVWHRQDVFLDIRVHSPDGLASASLLQMLFMESRHCLVPFWVLTRWETVRMLVWHRLSRSSLGYAYWS